MAACIFLIFYIPVIVSLFANVSLLGHLLFFIIYSFQWAYKLGGTHLLSKFAVAPLAFRLPLRAQSARHRTWVYLLVIWEIGKVLFAVRSFKHRGSALLGALPSTSHTITS